MFQPMEANQASDNRLFTPCEGGEHAMLSSIFLHYSIWALKPLRKAK